MKSTKKVLFKVFFSVMLQCQLLDGLPSHFVQAFAVLRV